MAKALLHELGKSLSYGRLSLRAKVLWPMLLASSDDQGRGLAEYDAIKWYVCPNVPEIETGDIAVLLGEMEKQGMIVVYGTDRGLVYQAVRWWEYQDLQWARPSKYDPPDGWTDRIRYSNRGDYHVDCWDTTGGFCAELKDKDSPDSEDVGQEPGKEPPRKPPDFPTQPNSTQSNSTEIKNTDGADAPEIDAPKDEGDLLADELFGAPKKKEQVSKTGYLGHLRDAAHGDPVAGMVFAAQSAQAEPWTISEFAGGADDWRVVADAFCLCIHGLRLSDMVSSDRKNWPRKLENIAGKLEASPAQMMTAIRVLPDDQSGYAFKVPGSYSSPYSKAFEPDIKIVLAKIKSGQLVPWFLADHSKTQERSDLGIAITPEMAAAKERARKRVESGVL